MNVFLQIKHMSYKHLLKVKLNQTLICKTDFLFKHNLFQNI